MEKLWNFTKKLRPIKGIVSKPKMRPWWIDRLDDKLYFTLVNQGGDCTLIYEFDPQAQDGTDIFEVGGIARNAPLVGSRLYFFRDRYYRCFDLATRSLVFEYELDWITGDTSSNPVIIEDRIYCGIISGFFCADRETGTKKWSLNFEDGEFGKNFFFCRGNIVISGYNDHVLCINTEGNTLWKSKMSGQYAYSYRDNIVLADDDRLYLLDGQTGKMMSSYKKDEDQTLYGLTEVESGAFFGTCKFSIDEEGFRKLWSVKIKGQYIATNCVTDDGKILFFDNKGNLYNVDAESGHTEISKPDTFKKISKIFVNDGKLYVFGENVEIDCFTL